MADDKVGEDGEAVVPPIKRIKVEGKVKEFISDDCKATVTSCSRSHTDFKTSGSTGSFLKDGEDVGEPKGDGDDNAGGGEVKEEDVKEVQNTILDKVPPEVWETILSHVGTPQEVYNVMNSCIQWQTLMASKRTTLLFPLVVPHIIQYLSPATLLSLRQVSKSWKKSIETPLQNHVNDSARFECHWWHMDSPYEPIIKYIEGPYLLHTSKEIENLTKVLSGHRSHQNPFISRTISIKFADGTEYHQSHQSAVTFLQKFGHHIWDFTHFCMEFGNNINLATVLLPSILSSLPNLKALKIDWTSEEGIIETCAETLDFLVTSRGQHFPELPYLTSLCYDFRGGDELESALGIALLQRYGRQLDTFVCHGEFLERRDISADLIRELLPNLKNLRIFCVTSDALNKLSQLRGFPLERLQLWYSFYKMRFRSVISAIDSFSSTLVQLHMDIKINYPLEGWGAIVNDLVAVASNTTDDSSENLEEFNLTFPKLKKVGAPVSSINSPWFWKMLKLKFNALERLDLQTTMETLFAPFDRDSLEKEIEESKGLFKVIPNLERIQFWFQNTGSLAIRRNS